MRGRLNLPAVLLVLVAVFAGWNLLTPWSPDEGASSTFDGLFSLGAAMAALVAMRHPSPNRRVIGLIALYLGGTAVAYGIQQYFVIVGVDQYPNVADAVWLTACIPYVAAVILMARPHLASIRTWLLDGVIVMCSVGVLVWELVFDPLLQHPETDAASKVASALYPFFDIIPLAVLALLIARGVPMTRTSILLALSVCSLATADVAAALFWLENDDSPVVVAINGLYDFSYVFLGATALALAKSKTVRRDRDAPKHPSLAYALVVSLVPAATTFFEATNLHEGSTSYERIELCAMTAITALVVVLLLVQLSLALRDLHNTRAELDRADAELRESQKMRAIGQLAAGLAHEINTPVQFVHNNLEYVDRQLRKVTEPPDSITGMTEALEESLEGVDRIAEIVKAVRAYGHPSGDVQADVDINGMIRSTIVLVGGHARQYVDLHVEFQDVAPVSGSMTELSQVVMNLINNAVDAMENVRSRGKIVVSTFMEDDNVVVKVTDNGSGMSQEVRDRIFEPMFTTKKVGHGMGHGLALVWAIVVERHNGTIVCESTEDIGTTFTVRLPAAMSTSI